MDPGNGPARAQLAAMDGEQIQQEIERTQADLEDLRELRRGFLGQTGVHIGYRVLRQVTSQLDSEEARLRERLRRLEGLLHESCLGQ